MMKRLIMMMFVLAFVFAMNVQSVQAVPIDPTLTLSDGVTTVTVSDSDLDGIITYIGGVGSWIVNITTGLTMPLLGSSTSPYMDLNSVDVSSPGAGTLTIWFSVDGFTYTGSLVSSVGGTTAGTVDFDTWIDYGTTPTIVSSLGTYGPGSFSGTTSGGAALTSGNTLDLVASITHTSNNTSVTSFNYDVQVPEPATLLLLGTGLVGVGIYRWRRTKKQK